MSMTRSLCDGITSMMIQLKSSWINEERDDISQGNTQTLTVVPRVVIMAVQCAYIAQ